MFAAKWKQLTIAVGAGRVTLPYPFAPHEPAPGFRGLPAVDGATCVGCGACAHSCPARLFTLNVGDSGAILTGDLARCTYCGRCAEVCPTGAMQMTGRFETAVTSPRRLSLRVELAMAHCDGCGRPLRTTRHMVAYARSMALGDEAAQAGLCPACKRRRTAHRLVFKQVLAAKGGGHHG